ncbi:MAG TPA: hypothetical protein VNF27_12450 [Candidatus Binataceae bacterium]|nr:hypothetical protein [Candidatus Binataceae bacterium]
MNSPERDDRERWFQRRLAGVAMAAAPIARASVATGHLHRVPLSELLWALGAIAIWGGAMGAFFAFARVRRRRTARERIKNVRITRYVDLTRKPSDPAAEPDGDE